MKLSKMGVLQFVVFFAALCTGVSGQQVAVGTSKFGSFGGGPFDLVNLGNLNVHFTIPVMHKAGRGMPFNFDLTYDSSAWTTTTSNGVTQWTPTPNWGWQSGTPFGSITYSVFQSPCQYWVQQTQQWVTAYTVYQYQNWVFVDRSGTKHPLNLNWPGFTSYWLGATAPAGSSNCTTVPDTYPSGSGSVADGSGYTISIANVSAATVTSRNGSQFGQTTVTDSNGNQITSNTSGQYFDTLSSTKPVLTVSGGAPSATTFKYTPPSGEASGTTVSYAMNYVKYTVATAFGVTLGTHLIGEYGPIANYLVDNVTLPDGTAYRFTYEAGPSGCVLQSGTSSCVTGRIASITLPTGGVITYTYSGGTNNTGIYSDGSTAGLTRMLSPTASCAGTIPTGCFQYSRSLAGGTPGPGSTWSTTVTDPVGNQSFINFVEDSVTTTSTTTATYNMYETNRQIYQGLINSSNCSSSNPTNCLLSTVITCYTPYVSSCTTTAVSSPTTYKQVTKYYPDSSGWSSAVGVTYNSSGLPTAVWTGSATQTLQSTSISYTTFTNNPSMVDRPSTVSTSDSVPNVLSKTTYSYDESTYPVQTPTATTPQHVSVTKSRGNLTSITYYTAASTTLSKHFQYYDTGMRYKSWDVSGSSSSFTKYTYDSTQNGSYTKSCGNSFPTTVTSPPTPNVASGISVSATWDCFGAVATGSTDPNNNSVSTAFTDSYFWRPASTQDQLLNTTTFGYTAATSSTPASVESKMPFNGTTSISEQFTTLDPFGRVVFSQREQSPTSIKYDSVETTYDILGQVFQTSMPYSGTVSAGPATPVWTTRSYDALGRPVEVDDGQSPSGYVQYSYNQNDVLQVIGPAPAGESLKQKQMEYDALGRLTSVCEITAGTALWASGSCGQTSPGSGYLTTYSYGTTTINSVVYPSMTVTQNAQAAAANQQTRKYVRDLLGRLIQELNPETGNHSPGTTYYTYDLDSSGTCTGTYSGDLVKKVDNRGNATCYTYDSLHRVQTVTYATSSPDKSNTDAKTFVYDAASYSSTAMLNAIGQLAEAYTGSSSSKVTDEFFSYSVRGELTDLYQHTPNSPSTYYHSSAGYFANGAAANLSLVSPASVLPSQTFKLEGRGLPSGVTSSQSQNSNVVTSTTYDVSTYTTTVNYGSGDSDIYVNYKTTGRLKTYTFKVGSASDVGTLTWNKNGTLGTLQIADAVPGTADSQTCNYTHDDMVRISSVNCGNTIWRQNFDYDPFGNITKDSAGWTGLSFSPGYDTTNQFTSLGTLTPTYDTDGRLTYDGVNHYTWDVNNMLYTIDTSPNSTKVIYDALGRMVEKQVGTTYTQIVYSPLGSKLAVMAGSNLQKGFVPLPGGSTAVYTSAGLAYIRHTDHLGSSRLSTTPSRTLYSSTAYAPFGEQYAQSGTMDNSFTGDDQDTIAQASTSVSGGMYDTLMRKQMPVQGRWLSPDPAGLGAVDPSNPQTWNRYAYVMNNPMSQIDPFGEDCYSAGSPGSQDCGGGGSLMWQDMGGIFSDPFSLMQTGYLTQVGTTMIADLEYPVYEFILNMASGDGPLGPNLGPFNPPLPQKGFCSFTANANVSQDAQGAIKQLFNQAGVGIDFGSGAAQLSVSSRSLGYGTLGDDSGGPNAVVDVSQALFVGYDSTALGVLIAHEWGHFVTGCSHSYPGSSDYCGNWGLMSKGDAFGKLGMRGQPLLGNPNLPQWQFQPSQFQSIRDKCTAMQGHNPV